MTDARHLGLVVGAAGDWWDTYDLRRCYRQLRRHGSPHRGCQRAWINDRDP